VTNQHVLQNWNNSNSLILPAVGIPAADQIGTANWNEPATWGVNLTYRYH